MTKPKLLIDADDGCDDFPYQPVARNRRAEQERFAKRTLMKHPLTDAELHDKFNGYREEGWCNSIYCPDDMRAAYDLGRDKGHAEMLELAVEWLQNCDLPHSLSYSNEYRSDRYLVVNAFKKAMRPTQEDNK